MLSSFSLVRTVFISYQNEFSRSEKAPQLGTLCKLTSRQVHPDSDFQLSYYSLHQWQQWLSSQTKRREVVIAVESASGMMSSDAQRCTKWSWKSGGGNGSWGSFWAIHTTTNGPSCAAAAAALPLFSFFSHSIIETVRLAAAARVFVRSSLLNHIHLTPRNESPIRTLFCATTTKYSSSSSRR